MSSSSPSRNGQFWDAKRQAKRDKGLCSRCNEKFGPGHHCKQSSLVIVELIDDEERIEEVKESTPKTTMANFIEISFYAILGKTSSTAKKILGTLMGREVLKG